MPRATATPADETADSPPGAAAEARRLVEAETRAWVRRAVVGLGLCPYAKAVDAARRVRYRVSDATDAEGVLADLVDEVGRLLEADPDAVETTLLIHPYALNDFIDYNDFLDVADRALDELDADGELQVASFHPDYRFEGSAPDDVSNATNRSPYPLLQLLREASVERAVAAQPDVAETIVAANLRTLDALGADGWAALRAACRDDALRAVERVPADPA